MTVDRFSNALKLYILIKESEHYSYNGERIPIARHLIAP